MVKRQRNLIMAFDPISAALGIGEKLIDRLWPDPAQRDSAKLELLKMQQTGELAQLASDTQLAKGQLAINAKEAAHSNIFVSGWRPFIGWVCGVAFAYALVLQPMMVFILAASGKVLPPLPNIDTNLLGWALGGILGLGTMRTTEKIKRVTK